MRNAFEAIVVGAGIVGASCARALASAGGRVLLISRRDLAGEASPAAAGMLAPQIEAHEADVTLDFAVAGRERLRTLAAELAATGHDIACRPRGILHVALEAAGASALERQAAAQRAIGLEAEYWDRAAILERVPGAGAEVAGGLFAPRDGHLDNVALLAALLDDARARGVTIAHGRVTALETGGGSVTGVRRDDALDPAPIVVLAAGAWTPAIGNLPRPVPIAPVRGQMAATSWPAGEPRMVLFGPGAYVVPRGEHAILGSTMEDAGFDARTTAEGIERIRLTTGRLLPSLLSRPITRTWAGLRPVTPDTRPIIGPDPDLAGLVYACGHGRNGVLLGPLTGDVVRDLVVRGETNHDLSPYSVSRFARAGNAAQET